MLVILFLNIRTIMYWVLTIEQGTNENPNIGMLVV